jgi:hypothetical protein
MTQRSDVTPDGIERRDWDRVHELAVEIANASSDDDVHRGSAATPQLFETLNDLERQYGPLPSILATWADYVDDPREQEALYLRAYAEAEARADKRNMVWVASSLAALYIEEIRDGVEGVRWLAALSANLVAFPDEYESQEHERLRKLASVLDGRSRD